jgi:hypothetical protein
MAILTLTKQTLLAMIAASQGSYFNGRSKARQSGPSG